MNFKDILIFFLFFLFFSYGIKSQNEYSRELGKYGAWKVYSKSKNLCFMISKPRKSEGTYKTRGKVRMVVFRNSKKYKDRNLVGFDFGYPFSHNSKVKIEIDNNKDFKLSTFDQMAWTGSRNKPINNKKIINEMIKGNKLVALGKSERGTLTKDTYSLDGFSKAFQKIKSYCG